MSELSPMLKQYMSIKSEYPDAILFFRMGDFYEMFFEDAVTASKILGITLTARGSCNGERVPMCGIPHHSSRSYMAKLIESGRKVAVCEQIGDPRETKGIVKREVVRIVTPGSITDEESLDNKSNLYMAAISGISSEKDLSKQTDDNGNFGLAYLDLSTGEFLVTELSTFAELLDELGRIAPAEVIIPENELIIEQKGLSVYRTEILEKLQFDIQDSESLLKEQLGVRSLTGFGCHGMHYGIIAAGAMVHYLLKTQKGFPAHIKEITSYHTGDFMFLDESTCSHLELLKTMKRQSIKGSLYQILDNTMTPMGSRMLRKWITYPLTDLDSIRKRLAAVSCFKEDRGLRDDMRIALKDVYDIERLNGRVAMGRANARDLLALKSSILALPFIKQALDNSISPLLAETSASMDTLQDLACLIDEAIHDEPPVSLKEGGIIKEGYNDELDRLISLSRKGKSWITEFAASEQERTGIPKLKVGFNKIFGYYLEVSHVNQHMVPPDYIRKQTLVNGERYITEALKEMEEQVLGAEEKRIVLEAEIFEEIRAKIALENRRIKHTSELVGLVDITAGLAETAELNNYVCPEMNDSSEMNIVEARHPVIELMVKEEEFVPNDIDLNSTDQQVLIITGPNMAGKSTILRQTALVVLMAQMGSFVAAKKAEIGVVDRIFTRVGASDDLTRGHSTFMVEMNETANILRHATPKSLVLLDEIGRGTSTYDGLSIAWAVAEALHDRGNKGVRTLFATHYHELTELVLTKSRVKNFNIAVREWNNQVIFLRKLVPGGTSRSYGIQVARIAGMPENVVKRAEEILNNLEKAELDGTGRPRLARKKNSGNSSELVQLSLFSSGDEKLTRWIKDIDISNMTPLEAMLELDKLKKHVVSEADK